jgi:hypothetical protein
MGLIEKNGVPSFFSKLKTAQRDLPQYYADGVAKKAYEIAFDLYAGEENSFILETKSGEGGESELIASGANILYQEYGTGRVGASSGYPEDKQIVTQDFYSNKLGRNVHLTKWTYSYANAESNGKFPKITGRDAGKQMLNTSLELRRLYGKYIKE